MWVSRDEAAVLLDVDPRTVVAHFTGRRVGTLHKFHTSELARGNAAAEERMIAQAIGMRNYTGRPKQHAADQIALRNAALRAQIEARSQA